MIFKCYLCAEYKFWNNKTCYQIIATDSAGNEKMVKRVCKSCGEQVDDKYNEARALSDIEVVDNEE